jgi:hypothetical protein
LPKLKRGHYRARGEVCDQPLWPDRRPAVRCLYPGRAVQMISGRKTAYVRRVRRKISLSPGPGASADTVRLGNKANARHGDPPERCCGSSTERPRRCSRLSTGIDRAVQTGCARAVPTRLVGRRLVRLRRKEFTPVLAGRRILDQIPSVEYIRVASAVQKRRVAAGVRSGGACKPPAHVCGSRRRGGRHCGSAQCAPNPSALLAPRPAPPAHGFPRSHGPSKSWVNDHRLRAG